MVTLTLLFLDSGLRTCSANRACLFDLDRLRDAVCRLRHSQSPHLHKSDGLSDASVKHPFLQILDNCPASLVAEDIELSLMILSNYTATTSLSRNTDPLHDCYQKLSLLMNVANKVRDYHISQFGGATLQRSRLRYTEDSVNATKVREFVEAWIERTARDGLWEYKKPLQAKKGRPKSNRAEEKSTEKKSKNWEESCCREEDAVGSVCSSPSQDRSRST